MFACVVPVSGFDGTSWMKWRAYVSVFFFFSLVVNMNLFTLSKETFQWEALPIGVVCQIRDVAVVSAISWCASAGICHVVERSARTVFQLIVLSWCGILHSHPEWSKKYSDSSKVTACYTSPLTIAEFGLPVSWGRNPIRTIYVPSDYSLRHWEQ